MYKSCTSFVTFIPKYFILVVCSINRISSLISSWDSSLLQHRNTIFFFVLILYPGTLSNSFISSNGFLVDSLEFYVYKIISCARDSFTSSFPVGFSASIEMIMWFLSFLLL